ncbi:MAG: hypothetical protein IKI11_07385, partial [Neisseriaceae bacterium]|nr:hypothetical protein [Neisseriaceae bacterium]
VGRRPTLRRFCIFVGWGVTPPKKTYDYKSPFRLPEIISINALRRYGGQECPPYNCLFIS